MYRKMRLARMLMTWSLLFSISQVGFRAGKSAYNFLYVWCVHWGMAASRFFA